MQVMQVDSRTHTVSTHFVRLLTQYAESRGLSATSVLARQGLGADALDDADWRVPFVHYDRMLEFAAAQLDEPHLGLRLGSLARVAHLGAGGLAQMACRNVQELLARTARYNALIMDAFEDDISVEGNEIVLRWRCRLPANLTVSRHHGELNFAMTQSLIPHFTGVQIFPTRVCFSHAQPAHPKVLDDFFRCKVEFEAPVDLMACSAEILTLQLHPTDPTILQMLDRVCEQQLKAVEGLHEPEWLHAAKQAITASLPDGQPELDQVARTIGLSERQLRRRLTEYCLSFRSLIDERRRELARSYMADPRLSLLEVAMLLGFSEQSAFQRAYRRWTGEAPGSTRRAML